MAVVVRLVSPAQFGVFAVAMTVYAVVSSLGELGLGSVLSRRDLDVEELAPTLTVLTAMAGCTLAGLTYLGSEPLAVLLGSADARGSIQVLSLAVLSVGVFAVPSARLTRDFRQDKIFLANAIALVPSNVVLVVLAANGAGALSFAWSRVLAQIVQGLCVTAFVGAHQRAGWSSSAARTSLAVGLPLAGANVISCVLLNADYALLGSLLGPHQLGLYVLAFNVASWSTMTISGMVNSVALSAFSELKGEPGALPVATVATLRLTALVVMPIAALTAATADPLIRTIYGEPWTSAAPVLAVLALYNVLVVPSLVLTNVCVALGLTRSVLYLQSLWLLLLLPALWAGIEFGGTVGAAVAHVVIVCTVLPLQVKAVRQRCSLTLVDVARPLVSPATVALGAFGVGLAASRLLSTSWTSLLIGIAVGGTCYLLLLLALMRGDPHVGSLLSRVRAAWRGVLPAVAAEAVAHRRKVSPK